ncbi:MAG: tryptophan 7-halogenase [Gammaproteobacteria bacterium]|nr:tryptophan 7-halogenase [Gammaproteobacteria bacterium]NNC58196.1 tryptophan 7-halogenase [Woeseiaceae bacterium]
MSDPVNTVVIVGGGTAGWLTAGLLAAEHRCGQESGLKVVLIESPDVSPIGVGEGTWPTMRTSLQTMGVSETDFVRHCDASFKQGTRFIGWLHGQDESYYHPFYLPPRFHEIDLARHWQPLREQVSYADAVTPQSQACDRDLAPKQITTPEFASALNYGYHLDAGKFSKFLEGHCVEKLGVSHILDNVVAVNAADNGDIQSLSLNSGETVHGDLFVDCTGFAALLLGKHYDIPYCSKRDYLFNDRALAIQVPRGSPDEAIASTTLSTAQRAGWIWDIALPKRRGVGYVYSSAYTSDEEAEADLRHYISETADKDFGETCSPRQIKFSPGHREKLWHRNCVAIGLSGGFVEPLEASALVMVELSAKMLSEQLPANRSIMDIVARRFNEKFLYDWHRIIEFLKLHYVLSKRDDSDYWRDNRDPRTIPPDLKESLELWRYQSPRYQDLFHADELFPAASYRYVLYGMDFETEGPNEQRRSDVASRTEAESLFGDNIKRTKQVLKALPTNRELISKIHEFGFQKI